MRRTVDDGVSTWAGCAAPMRMGPMVEPSRFNTLMVLNRMLAESRFGQIRMLASPLSRLSMRLALRMVSDSAASACISPSHSTFGASLEKIS
jgi:hypothetical protein